MSDSNSGKPQNGIQIRSRRGTRYNNSRKSGQKPDKNSSSYSKPNGFLSFVLCFFAVISLCAFMGLMVLRSAGVSNIIRNTDILYYLEDASFGEHEYYVVDQINTLPFSNTELSLSDIENFIKKETVSDSIGGILDDYALAFTMGNLDHHVTTDDIVNVARDLDEEISELFGHDMTEDDFEFLAERLDDILDFSSLTIDGLMEDFDVDMSVPLVLLSPALRWLVGTLGVLLLLAIFFIRIGNIPAASLATGIPVLLSGAIVYGAGMFLDAATHTPDSMFQRFERFLQEPITMIMRYSLVFAIVGGLIVVVSFVVGKVLRKT